MKFSEMDGVKVKITTLFRNPLQNTQIFLDNFLGLG